MDDFDKDVISKAIEEISNIDLNTDTKAVYVLKCDHPPKDQVRELADENVGNQPGDAIEELYIEKLSGTPLGTDPNITYAHRNKEYPAYVEIALRADNLYYVGKVEKSHPLQRIFNHVLNNNSANFFQHGFYPVRIEKIQLTEKPNQDEERIAKEYTKIESDGKEIIEQPDSFAYKGYPN